MPRSRQLGMLVWESPSSTSQFDVTALRCSPRRKSTTLLLRPAARVPPLPASLLITLELVIVIMQLEGLHHTPDSSVVAKHRSGTKRDLIMSCRRLILHIHSPCRPRYLAKVMEKCMPGALFDAFQKIPGGENFPVAFVSERWSLGP